MENRGQPKKNDVDLNPTDGKKSKIRLDNITRSYKQFAGKIRGSDASSSGRQPEGSRETGKQREVAAETRETTREPISEEEFSQIKQELSHAFRNPGGIQQLSEEKFTLKVVEQAFRHDTTLGNQIIDLIKQDDHTATTDHGLAQARAARAFSFASHYMSNLYEKSSKTGETPTSEIEFQTVAKQAIRTATADKQGTIKSRLFIPVDSSINQDKLLRAGHMNPQKEWTPEVAKQGEIEKILATVDLQEKGPILSSTPVDCSITQLAKIPGSLQILIACTPTY